MNALATILHPFSDSAAVQYLMALALLSGLLVATLVALVYCKSPWLHRYLQLGRLSDLFLSSEPRQRTICLRYMVAAVNCVAGIAALNYGVVDGVISAEGTTKWLTISGLLIVLIYYIVIRTGLNKRLPDPTMVSFHTSTAIVYLAWGYLIGGPGRPVALMLLFIILMFSMFTRNVRNVIQSSTLAATSFGLVMAYVASTESQLPHVAHLQLVYFCLLMTMLISVCLLMAQLTKLRAQSTRRKEELTEALNRIQELATRDELTGLYNRRHMLEVLNTEKHRSIRSDRCFCIALVDVDHFKTVNDTHGHGVGDEVLTEAASAITRGLRETDVVARWGGEEFLIMFTDTDCGTADMVLSRIQQALSDKSVSASTPALRVTFSAGLTAYDGEEMLTRTIDRADRALYMAKASGRNRVISLGTDGEAVSSPIRPDTTFASTQPGSLPLEDGHALDMSRMRKHVHRTG